MARTTPTTKILLRLEKGMDDPERIAREAGCSRQYVDRIAKRGGYSLKTRLTGAAELRERVSALVKKGLKPIEIEAELGETKRRVAYHLAKLQAVRPQRAISAEVAARRQDALKRRRAGEPVISIAKSWGVHPQVITNDLHGHQTRRSMDQVRARREKILAWHAEGKSTAWIAARVNLKAPSVQKTIRLHGRGSVKK